MRIRSAFTIILAAICISGCDAQGQPGVEEFKKVFEAQLQKLKPTGFTKRSVVFKNVVKGTSNGGVHTFKVQAYVHDYGPGYPSNRYYGQSCLGYMDGWKFDMKKDEFGDWIVQGRFTVTDSECRDNPAEGQEAIPLSGVPGKPYVANQETSPVQTSTNVKNAPASKLYIGEYASYGTGNRLMAGMGFILKSNGRYTDVDNERGGSYIYNAKLATITFKGGFLDGQVGKNVSSSGFDLSNTVRCEPWR